MESRYSVIDLDALAFNFLAIKQKVGNTKIMAVVKANAYGHGIVECSLFLQAQGINYFGVAFIEEAITLRNAGITEPILVMGGVMTEQVPLFLQYDIEIMASSIHKLQMIDAYARSCSKKAKVHLKVDTGLGRIGVRYSGAHEFFQVAMSLAWIEVVGVASHFATSDYPDTSFMRLQFERFMQAIQFFPDNGYPMPLRHIANSGAIMQYPESYCDMVRPGIMLYGVYPQTWMQSLLTLEPVMSLYVRVVYFKILLQGAAISYGLRWRADCDTRIITLPIGYGDGYPCALSNKGCVLLNGKKYPLVGSVCMDQMMVNIGTEQSAYCGDEVVLIGKSGNASITINELVDYYGGSSYEFMVLLNSRIARRYTQTEKAARVTIPQTYEVTTF